MEKIKFLILLIVVLVISSCSSRFRKYESNWIVTKFEVDGKDKFHHDYIKIYNFEICVYLSSATPITLRDESGIRRRPTSCDIKFYRKGGKDYIVIFDHYFFAGTYEISCLDKKCCTIEMKNERIYLEMDYNGELPIYPQIKKPRKCP